MEPIGVHGSSNAITRANESNTDDASSSRDRNNRPAYRSEPPHCRTFRCSSRWSIELEERRRLRCKMDELFDRHLSIRHFLWLVKSVNVASSNPQSRHILCVGRATEPRNSSTRLHPTPKQSPTFAFLPTSAETGDARSPLFSTATSCSHTGIFAAWSHF